MLRLVVPAVAVVPLSLVAAGCASTQDQASPPSQNVSASVSSALTSAPASSASASVSVSASSAAAAPCRTGELKVSLGPGGVAAGTWAALLEFTNAGNVSCTMTGWPTVAGITSAGAATPARNRSDAMDGLNVSGTPQVTLQPGGKAGIDISGTDNAAGGGSCPPPYRQLRVSAPGDSASVTVPADTSALSGGLPSCGPVGASPVHPLSDFSFSGQ
jgi:hypothetical protein